MTFNELQKRFPNCSADFLRANANGTAIPDRDRWEAPVVERHTGNGAVGSLPVQAGAIQKFLVRVTSFRRRLLDTDNLAEKYHVDLCRYAGIIPSDAPGVTQIEVRQEKVRKKEREFVRIQIFRL